MVVFPPKHISGKDRATYASLYAHGFEEGLKAPEIRPLFHLVPGVNPALEYAWMHGFNDGEKEFARAHPREFLRRFPGDTNWQLKQELKKEAATRGKK